MLSLKNRVALIFFTVLNMYFLLFRSFEEPALALKKNSYPDIFHGIGQVFFVIQKISVACACPEKQRVPWNFSLYGIYFLHSGVLSNMHALALKNRRCPDIFHCIEHAFFIIPDF